MIPALQLRVLALAGAGGDLAGTLGASAVNCGIAAGSLVGAAILAGSGARDTVLAAVILCDIALPATWATRFLNPPGHDERDDRRAVERDVAASPRRLAPQRG